MTTVVNVTLALFQGTFPAGPERAGNHRAAAMWQDVAWEWLGLRGPLAAEAVKGQGEIGCDWEGFCEADNVAGTRMIVCLHGVRVGREGVKAGRQAGL